MATKTSEPSREIAVHKRAPGNVGNLRTFLADPNISRNLAGALPKHMTADRMIRTALTAANYNPLILECTNESIALALLKASEMGVETNGRDAHLVPYKKKVDGQYIYICQLIVDYKGYVKLAYQSGQVKSCMAHAVYEHDHLDYKYGTNSYLDYKPADADDAGKLTHAWAAVDLKDGGSVFVVLNRSEIMRHKKSSQSATSEYSPWVVHEASMWAKTAFRELSKWIPISPHLERALQHDLDVDAGRDILDGAISGPVTVEPVGSTSDRLADKLGGSKSEVIDAEPAGDSMSEALQSFGKALDRCLTVDECNLLLEERGPLMNDSDRNTATDWCMAAKDRIKSKK